MKCILICCLFATSCLYVQADVIVWNGMQDSSWANGANWIGGMPAGNQDPAIVNAASNQPFIATLTSVTLKRLELMLEQL